MQTPNTAQLRTAIEVLTKFYERLTIEAAHSVVQLPPTPLGAHYARSIDARMNEQINRIEAVTTQLKNWRDELSGQESDASAEVPIKFRNAGDECMASDEDFDDLKNAVEDQWIGLQTGLLSTSNELARC
jgi:hypothetical protein